MNGVLVVDKPAGPTSHDVVALARRALGEKRIGHTGTLDPLATGVLALVVGRATRLSSLLTATEKEYLADIRFGATTETFDAEARMPAPAEPPGLNAETIVSILPRFVGTYLQAPPAYSAKKTAGVRAYEKARRNEAPALDPTAVTVSALVLEEYKGGLARVRLRSSAGFYVRSFAHELGQLIGCGAYLEALRRTAAAGFTVAEAMPLDALNADRKCGAVERLVPLGRLLPDLPGLTLNEGGLRRTMHGNPLSFADFTPETALHSIVGRIAAMPARTPAIRLLNPSGDLVAIASRLDDGLLHPAIVLM
jgi:tRNA pseudouridine55 synthase